MNETRTGTGAPGRGGQLHDQSLRFTSGPQGQETCRRGRARAPRLLLGWWDSGPRCGHIGNGPEATAGDVEYFAVTGVELNDAMAPPRSQSGLFESRIARIARRQKAAIRAESRGAQ